MSGDRKCVEVVPFDTLGVGQHDAAHAKCCDLCPQTPQHLRPRECEQQVDWRNRHRLSERAAQRDRLRVVRDHRADAGITVDEPDADLLCIDHAEHAQQMHSALVLEAHDAGTIDFVCADEDEVHDPPGIR